MHLKSKKLWSKSASAVAAAFLAAACKDATGSADGRAIDLERSVAIRDGADSVVIQNTTRLIAAPHGGFIAYPLGGPRPIAFHDSTGALRQLVGSTGKGPGEYQEVSSVGVGPGDSIFVSDRLNARMSVLSPGDHRLARSGPVPTSDAYFRGTPEGRLMGQHVSFTPTEGRKVYLARRVSWDGSTTTPIANPLGFDRIGRMAPADSGRVWVAEARSYTITLFQGDSAVRVLRRNVPWFPPDTSKAFVGIGKQTFVAAMGVGTEGMLWVLIRRPNPAWTGQTKLTGPVRPNQLPPLGEIFEGVLEVLDPKTGALIDSRVVPGDMIDFLRPGQMYQLTDADSAGNLMLQVWKAGLKKRN